MTDKVPKKKVSSKTPASTVIVPVPESESSNGCIWWTFTFIADDIGDDVEGLVNYLTANTSYYLFQLEKGETTGFVHYQGFLVLHTGKKKRKTELLKMFQEGIGCKPNYLCPISSNLRDQLKINKHSYFDKTETRVAGPWEKGVFVQYVPSQYDLKQLRPFQQDLFNLIQKPPDTRTIYQVIDSAGNSGKSTFAHYMRLKHGCIVCPPAKDAIKLMESVCDMLMSKAVRKFPCLFIDFPRSLNKRDMSEFTIAIEQFKAAWFYDMRHSWKEWDTEPFHIVVFTNNMLDPRLLTLDRWSNIGINRVTDALEPYRVTGYERSDMELDDDDVEDLPPTEPTFERSMFVDPRAKTGLQPFDPAKYGYKKGQF